MKVTIHIDLEEQDYIAILQVAGMKRITSEELIKQALREYINNSMQSFRTEEDRSKSGEDKRTEKEV